MTIHLLKDLNQLMNNIWLRYMKILNKTCRIIVLILSMKKMIIEILIKSSKALELEQQKMIWVSIIQVIKLIKANAQSLLIDQEAQIKAIQAKKTQGMFTIIC